MTRRIGSKGQVVIPSRLRERLGFGAGTEVDFEERGDGVLLRPKVSHRPLRGRFGKSGMAERLLEDRRSEPR